LSEFVASGRDLFRTKSFQSEVNLDQDTKKSQKSFFYLNNNEQIAGFQVQANNNAIGLVGKTTALPSIQLLEHPASRWK
jgi:hypothetical protein